jgi:hypothetical protein
MDASLAITLVAVGAAALALWLLARFPSFGPQTLGRATLLVAAAFVLQTPILSAVPPVVGALGAPAAVLLVILPALTLLFWALGCVVRSLVLMVAPYRR